MRVIRPYLLDYYLVQLYLRYLLASTGAALIFLTLSSLFDVLNRHKTTTITILLLVKTIIAKVPLLLSQIMPFLTLLAAAWLIYSLLQNKELLIMLNLGLSQWRLALSPLILTFMIATCNITLLNPLAVNTAKIDITNNDNNQSAKANNQKAETIMAIGNYNSSLQLVIAQGFNVQTNVLNKPLIIEVAENYHSLKFFLAPFATLTDHAFTLSPTAKVIPTNLSTKLLTLNLQRLDYYSFWELRSLLKLFKKVQVENFDYAFNYYKLLTQPIIATLMVALAIAQFKPNARNSKTSGIKGVGAGFLIYISSEALSSIIKAYIASIGGNVSLAVFILTSLLVIIVALLIFRFKFYVS